MEKNAKGFEFRKFATPRILGGIAIVIIILWALSIIFGTPQGPTSEDTAVRQLDSSVTTAPASSDSQSKTTLSEYPSTAAQAAKGRSAATTDTTGQDTTAVHGTTTMSQGNAADHEPSTSLRTATQDASGTAGQRATADTTDHATTDSHGTPAGRKTTDTHAAAAQDASGAAGQGAAAGTTDHATTSSHGTLAGRKTTTTHAAATQDASEATGQGATTHSKTTVQKTDDSHQTPAAGQPAAHEPTAKSAGAAPTQQTETHQQPVAADDPSTQTTDHGAASQTAAKQATTGHALPATAVVAPVHKPAPKGVAFVEATIKPLSYELEERWWGWRPNDIIEFTDNVNTFQLGVLEVTRRTTVALAERLSRTGSNDAFDENLEQAMNWFMIKASSYWFPSAESKYHEGLEELQAYLEKLRAGNATFYTRTDNLIPLLASFEDLLGSCDENLVKETHEDGTPLSMFDVDNYFFYTQGVASSMATVLEAVHHDFLLTLESRNATELLHHAIVSCQRAAEHDPWIVLDSNHSSIFANHRANMAAPISHARFYIGQLIKTLST